MEIVKEWISNMFIVIVTLTFLEILMPESSTGKYIKFIFSLVIMASIIYPLADLIGNI